MSDTPLADAKPGLIHERIIEVMRAIAPIAKSLRNEQQKFNYRGIDQVYNAVHPHFAEQGVYSTSTILSAEHKVGERTTKSGDKQQVVHAIVKMRFTFWTTDGSHVSTEVIGEGQDFGGDKASNKAMSVADKYAILQLLKIPTAMVDPDAPEKRPNPDADEQAPKTPTRAARQQTQSLEDRLGAIKVRWAKVQENLPDDRQERIKRFVDWVAATTGRTFNANAIAEWTEQDAATCEAKLKVEEAAVA
jgi:hypothetical protein